MTRECHLRFCERLRGKLPRSTHHFGMKAHIGVDAVSGMVHSLVGTPADVGDVTQTEHLLHGEEKLVSSDAGYTGVDKRPELKDKTVKWVVAAKRGPWTASFGCASAICRWRENSPKGVTMTKADKLIGLGPGPQPALLAGEARS